MKGRIYTREDIVKALDAEIAKKEEKLGKGSFWAKVAENKKEHVLARYDAGHVVLVEVECGHENGTEYEIEYFSDGSAHKVYY